MAAPAVARSAIWTTPHATASLPHVTLYALIASDTTFAVDLFPTFELADAALRAALTDEPTWSELLRVEEIDASAATDDPESRLS